MSIYFISDLHLHGNDSSNQRLLASFFNTLKFGDCLFILGDLFGLYLGDDLLEENGIKIAQQLKSLGERGIKVQIMRGNRDFLLGNKFCSVAGCKLLDDPFIFTQDNKTILLTHGDRLCTKDIQYQRFRTLVQSAFIKKCFLLLPKKLRIKIGNAVKTRSTRNTIPYTYDTKYDAVDEEVDAWLSKYQAHVIIHGHTHRPGIHQHHNGIRYVLGDWTNNSAKVLRYEDGEFRLLELRS